jgi:hypothetical protein
MNHRSISALFLAFLLCASTMAHADHTIAWRPVGSSAAISAEDRQRASRLARESIDLLGHNDIAGAEARLRDALAIIPDKAVWHYNLACILAARGQSDAAIESLVRAADYGFTDFTLLEGSNDMKPLRDLPKYKELIARKDEIRHKAAQRAMGQLQQQFGRTYLYEADEEHKLIFAASADQQTLDAIKKWLAGQAKTQAEDLFEHKPDEFIRVVIPSLVDYRKLISQRGVMGIYEDETRTLLVERLGQIMTHEFTHALHAADQRAVGQEHPVWLREGLAAMYEAGEFENGRLIPRDNFRLAYVQSAARRNALIPLEKMLKLNVSDFVQGPNLSYGQTSSVMLYLYDKKLLRKFYDVYKAAWLTDPTGQIALEEVTGMKLPELQKAWTAWMLERKAPPMTSTPGGAYLGCHFAQAVDGLLVSMVLPNSAASKAGLKNGDVIIGVDDHEVRDYASLSPVLAAHKVGDEVKLKVRREGKYIDVPVVLGQR